MLALKRKASGYTLLEILVTIAVVAIVASLAVPSFQNMIATQRVRSAANDLVAALNFARSEAVKRNRVVTVTPGAAWTAGWTITYVDSGGTTQTLQTHEAFEGVTLISSPAATAISYRADGRRNSANVEITISPPSSTSASKHCIGVSPTGKPESSTGAC